jgi:glycosyltransferase involved in cell wall biosynthesis
MAEPKIVIYIPVYNEKRFLEETILRIYGQTYRNFELIVSDNFSNDGSFELLAKLRDTYRFEIVRPAAHLPGVPHFIQLYNYARSKQSDYLIHFGAHDRFELNYLERLCSLAEENPEAVLISPQAFKMRDANHIDGVYANRTPQLIGSLRVFFPLTILALSASNVALHGLIRTSKGGDVPIRYECPAVDYFYIAELSSKGDIIVDLQTPYYQYASNSTGDHDTYVKKHYGLDCNDDVRVSHFKLELNYLSDLVNEVTQNYPASFKMWYSAAAFSQYFCRNTTLQTYHDKRLEDIITSSYGSYSSISDFVEYTNRWARES